MLFLVGLEGDPGLLHEIEYALNNPAFPHIWAGALVRPKADYALG